ncbi:unnamed protein product [Penicillium glandicola]
MKNTILLSTLALGFLPWTTAAPSTSNQPLVSSLRPRAPPDAPNGYAPAHVTCPADRPSIRSGATLSEEETSWLNTRREKTTSALKEFFGHVEIDNFNAVSYLESHSGNLSNLPNIGIAISGGGMRACLVGAGVIKAFDNRTEGAAIMGQLGGLLQSASYVSALSGGSWMLASVFVNNFTTISALQEDFWDFSSLPLFNGPSTLGAAPFWGNISAQVAAKRRGRIEGYTFFNASQGGVDLNWSSIAKTQAFQDGDMPLPLVVADGQYSYWAANTSTQNEPIYEFSPWEFGTYDDFIYGFAPLEYLGTRFVNGIVPDNETCVRGYDNAGLVIGTSSDIWNEEPFPDLLSETVNGPGAYDPNPFYQYNANTSPFAQDTRLIVADGGEDSQNIPLNLLIQRKRNVDIIFDVDAGSDTATDIWPNSEPLVFTYERTLAGLANDTSFPSIPDINTFVNLGLNIRPAFFGCNSSNLTTPAPLVVYLPNQPITYMSNVSMLTSYYNTTSRDAMILNSYNIATRANNTLDSNWSTCVGCAVLSRSFDRTGTTVPEICN